MCLRATSAMNFSLSEVRGVSWAAHDENLGVIVGFIVRLLCAQAEQPKTRKILLMPEPRLGTQGRHVVRVRRITSHPEAMECLP